MLVHSPDLDEKGSIRRKAPARIKIIKPKRIVWAPLSLKCLLLLLLIR